jgi:hypothetical protein
MRFLLIPLSIITLVTVTDLLLIKNRDHSHDRSSPSHKERESHGPIGKWDRVYPQKDWHA